ncbi:cytochrome c oxidase assembly protein [Xylanimonas oleitrophica]|uniref:Cytochrome c oxidase assembly protein n=1 Tax=Xylanimonas oleitrophica TaxID=2607479 RepID=A0A2W5WQU1_9MICO|nr:cytochrome c oxidase assembly protein [Xylanimonas oleitrophica]
MGLVRRRGALGRPWSGWRTAAWCAGALLLAVAVSPPLVSTAHADPAGHMVQHLLLGMYAPLGLVLAAPVTLLLGAASPAWRRRTARLLGSRPVHVLSHPVTAGLLTSGGLAVLYLTSLYAASLHRPWLHALVSVHFVASGCLFASAVAGPDPVPRRPSTATRAVVLVLTAAAHAVLAKWLYAHAGTLPPGAGHTPAATERAAQWMYYGGDVAEVLLACALFAGWRRARRHGARRTGRAGPGGPGPAPSHSTRTDRSTGSRAARTAGHSAASTPTRAATASITPTCPAGTTSSVMPSSSNT